jgi:hypothetical protein
VRNAADYESFTQLTGYRQYANYATTDSVSFVWVKVPVVGAPASGDLDGDGYVTMNEALIVAQAVVGSATLDAQQRAAVDMDGDGAITMTDVLLVMRKALGL